MDANGLAYCHQTSFDFYQTREPMDGEEDAGLYLPDSVLWEGFAAEPLPGGDTETAGELEKAFCALLGRTNRADEQPAGTGPLNLSRRLRRRALLDEQDEVVQAATRRAEGDCRQGGAGCCSG